MTVRSAAPATRGALVWAARTLTALALMALTAAGASSWAAEGTPQASPPSSETFVRVSNAMLRADEVPQRLAAGGEWSVSYMIPPGGQDPMPLCTFSSSDSVELDPSRAVAYRAGSYTGLTQQLYAYPSMQVAATAWRTAVRQVQRKCTARYTGDGNTTTVTSGPLQEGAGTRGWWIRTDQSRREAGGSYVTLSQAGASIQVLYVNRPEGNTTPRQRADMNALTPLLAARVADAAAAPVTQDPLLTAAQRSMMQPADVPTALPYVSPQDGGWSSFESTRPGTGPFACGPASVPAGVAAFDVGFGSGGPISMPGAIDQSVEVYADRARAEAAWRRLSRAVSGCSEGRPGPVTDTSSWTVAGTSPLVVDGTPAVWRRDLMVISSNTTKSYAVSLLAGRSIHTVTYSASVAGVRQVPVDEEAVNALAAKLALRFAGTIPN